MSEFIKVLLSLSLSGTLLMLLVLLPKPLYRKRFSRRWQYYIWLVVALRFILPITPGSTFTGYLFARMETAMLPDIGENQPVSDMPAAVSGRSDNTAVLKEHSETSNYAPDSPSLPDHDAPNIPFLSDHYALRLPHPEFWLFGIWLTGTALLLIRKVTLYQSFLHTLRAGSRRVSDIEILNLLAGCAERLKIKRGIELCTNPMLTSPIMVGFLHPCILLPAKEIPETPCDSIPTTWNPSPQDQDQRNPQELQSLYLHYIFTHELIHYKRRDMYYKWFVQLVLCIHWFNPFVYRLVKETGSACEFACDEAVTASLDDAGKRAYGNTLLAFLRAENTYKNASPYVTLTEGAKNLKERLGAIMKSRKNSKYTKYITAIVTLLICISFTALGAYAKSDSNSAAPGSHAKSDSSSAAPGSHATSGSSSSTPDAYAKSGSSSAALTGSFWEYDRGVYYIYADGAGKSSKPVTGFTDGTTGVVLIQKDGYTSLGPFDPADADSFREQLAQTCENMVKNSILTRENADIILAFAEDIVLNLPLCIVHESAEIRFYQDGSPYLHDVITNHTDQTITETEYCMLAYNADGQPLKLKWNFMDSSAEESFSHLVTLEKLNILPGQTRNYWGGWSLEADPAAEMACYIFCLKKVVFEDGAVWNNPEYESWYETYAGKEIPADSLETYYPHEYSVIR